MKFVGIRLIFDEKPLCLTVGNIVTSTTNCMSKMQNVPIRGNAVQSGVCKNRL